MTLIFHYNTLCCCLFFSLWLVIVASVVVVVVGVLVAAVVFFFLLRTASTVDQQHRPPSIDLEKGNMAASFPAGGETPASNHPAAHHPPSTHSLPQRNVSINVSEPPGQAGGLHPAAHHSTPPTGTQPPPVGGPKLSRWASLRSDSKDSTAHTPTPAAVAQQPVQQQQVGAQQQVDFTNKVCGENVQLTCCIT